MITSIFSLVQVPNMASIVSSKRSRVGRLGSFADEFPCLFHRLANAVGQSHTPSYQVSCRYSRRCPARNHQAVLGQSAQRLSAGLRAWPWWGSTSTWLKPGALCPTHHRGEATEATFELRHNSNWSHSLSHLLSAPILCNLVNLT